MRTEAFENIAVIGAGTMGAQIALQCAVHGLPVSLFSRSNETLQRAAAGHVRELDQRITSQRIAAVEKASVLNRIHYTTHMPDAVASADLIIESAPEDLGLKRELFARLDQLSPPRAVLASNSSSIRISAIESATQRPGQLLNLHFYYPVWQRAMVELMGGTATLAETIERARRFVQTLAMTPLIVHKESTGFVFNRVWRAIKKECLQVADSGVASYEDIDRAWMIAIGMPVGPFGLMDMVGLDVVRDIELVYYRESGDESDAPPRILQDKVERGELGVKSGRGFYSYPDPAFQRPGWVKGEADFAAPAPRPASPGRKLTP